MSTVIKFIYRPKRIKSQYILSKVLSKIQIWHLVSNRIHISDILSIENKRETNALMFNLISNMKSLILVSQIICPLRLIIQCSLY